MYSSRLSESVTRYMSRVLLYLSYVTSNVQYRPLPIPFGNQIKRAPDTARRSMTYRLAACNTATPRAFSKGKRVRVSAEGSRKSTCHQRYAGSRTSRATRIRRTVRQTTRLEGWMEQVEGEREKDREGEHRGGEDTRVKESRSQGVRGLHPYLLTSAKSITCLRV